MTELPKRRLGNTDMDITVLGFGAWAIGGGDWAFTWGPQDDNASVAAIRHAVSRGINWIDTAASYGLGHSEEVVGRALRDIPADERPFVFTKCGLVADPAQPMVPSRRVGDPASIRQGVDDSLRRLEVDRIDLMQMHWPAEDGVPVEEYWGAMLELQQAGKVREVGLSNHSVEQLTAAEKVGHVATLQPPFSMINRAAAAELLPWCEDNGAGVIAYSPLQSGLLTGAFSLERLSSLDAKDWRLRNPEFQDERLNANLALVDAVRSVSERHDVSVSAAAIAWVLAFRGVSGAIVGARSTEQVDGWIAAGGVQLTDEDFGSLATVISETGAGQGPSSPRT
jgi:aryl-alcohol dehydrogenase-like predicted oxidoreductase